MRPIAPFLKWLAISLGCGLTAVVAGLALSIYCVGSLEELRSQLNGDPLSASPASYDLGVGSPGEQREAVFRLRNFTDRPIRITGGSTSCTCVTQDDYPIVIPPAATMPLTLKIRLSRSPGPVAQSLTLFTDCAAMPDLTLQVRGAVASGAAPRP